MNSEEILLSVCMVSYNQEAYIKEALDSVLMQKTSFDYEIIISDDYSKDRTIQILQDYARNYPEKIRVITGIKNVGYPNNQRRSLEAAKGKYIALCDGDDYWTDPFKLQKQVDYMEAHPDYAICFHNVMHIYEGTALGRSLLNPLDFPSELTAEDMITRKWFLPTNSEVFRREYLFFPEWYDSVLHIDYVLNLIMSFKGALHYMPDVMAVYRHTNISVNAQHNDGEWGYMLFHSETMKNILENTLNIADEKYRESIKEKVDFYDLEIEKYKKEQYYENHRIARFFRLKTYKRIIKRKLLVIFRTLMNS